MLENGELGSIHDDSFDEHDERPFSKLWIIFDENVSRCGQNFVV